MNLDYGDLTHEEAAAQREQANRSAIETGLYVLADLLGDDHPKVRHAQQRAAEFQAAAGTAFTARYVQWAVCYPNLINEDPANQTCYCPDSGGWVPEVTEEGIECWRPCTRCNRAAHEAMLVRAGLKEPEPTDG